MWAPERVQALRTILTRYAEHLQVDDVIRRGVDGDPIGVYRGDDRPKGRVTEILERSDDGVVRFRAVFDGEELVLSNCDLHPKGVWEIDKDHVPIFRGRVRGETPEVVAAPSKEYRAIVDEQFESFRGELNTTLRQEIDTLRELVDKYEETNAEFRTTTASALREMSGDLLSSYRGGTTSFAQEYVDRYDAAMRGTRPSHKGADRNDDAFQDTKTEYECGIPTVSGLPGKIQPVEVPL